MSSWLCNVLVQSDTVNLLFFVGMGCEDNRLSAYIQTPASIKGLWKCINIDEKN